MGVEVARNLKDFDCDKCKWGRHCDSSNPAPVSQWVIPGVIESNTCLKPMVTESTNYLLRLYMHYKNGLLPLSGGLLDQPAGFLRAMEIIEGAQD